MGIDEQKAYHSRRTGINFVVHRYERVDNAI